MLTIIFLLLLVTVFGRVALFALKAGWGIFKFLLTVVLIPLALVGMALSGMMIIALVVMVVIGLIFYLH